MAEKMKKQKVKKQNKSIGGLLERIARIEKKLDIINGMSKTMPVVVMGTAVLLGSLLYLNSVATIPEDEFSLPQTGSEETITEDFVIIYPEPYSSFSLPDEVIGLSTTGFYPKDTSVTFYVKNSSGEIFDIGSATKGDEEGEYRTTWPKYESGRYEMWVEIMDKNDSIQKTETIIVEVK